MSVLYGSAPTVLVAAHKPYWMPPDSLYLPVQVNAASASNSIPGFVRDDDGDNISNKNARYSELTALWWGWRNLDCKALGLAHYRRHFAGSGEGGVLTLAEAEEMLKRTPVVVPTMRNYMIESVASHYAHTHDSAHLDALRAAVRHVSPQRLAVYDTQMASIKVHMFNMMIMRREVLDPYCTWLFDVLSSAEERISFDGMIAFEERCVGRLGEFLLDVWLRSEDVPYEEVPLIELEGVNWVKKGSSFLAAKFLGRTYNKSF
ncbi:MAG: DUF4422 domain-containing protein [Atopobiaceae bacterium]|nr:DUF4422 domain-containing protein [Atopobiaceae bacterium]